VSDDSELIIPASLDSATSDAIRQIAIDAYQSMDCAGLGRVDMLMERSSGRIYLNEINTIPGFTRISMYPKLWEASGLPYSELLDRLIELAIERSEEKSMLKTMFEVDSDG
jgi:D-alanine-D-alanine ligase